MFLIGRVIHGALLPPQHGEARHAGSEPLSQLRQLLRRRSQFAHGGDLGLGGSCRIVGTF